MFQRYIFDQDGDGYGHGNGHGDGNGHGYGDGFGYGFGFGDGDGMGWISYKFTFKASLPPSAGKMRQIFQYLNPIS